MSRWCYGGLRVSSIKDNQERGFNDPVYTFEKGDKEFVTFAALVGGLIWPLIPAVKVVVFPLRYIQGSPRLSEWELKKNAEELEKAERREKFRQADEQKRWDEQFTQLDKETPSGCE
jgi:hypothetical protein